MALLSLRDVSFGFGSPPLLSHVDLQIERGERVGLLGRNGTGKSTLMKLMVGELPPDQGLIEQQQGSDCPAGTRCSCWPCRDHFDEVAAGLGSEGIAVAAQFHLHHPDAR